MLSFLLNHVLIAIYSALFCISNADQCGVMLSRNKIVGGQETGGYRYPWFALLRLRTAGDPAVCAGSLITSKHILTAAHCFTISTNVPSEKLFTVALGVYNRCATSESTREIFQVLKVFVHEEYTSEGKFHDIALMTLDRETSATVVCLPVPSPSTVSEEGLIVGFGVTRQGNRVLPCRQRQAKVAKMTTEQCSRTKLPQEDATEPTVFCGGAKGVDSCQGDSGGAFLTLTDDGRYIIAGIVSFGYGCARNGLPGVYTNVASYLGWIDSKINSQGISSETQKGHTKI